MFSSDIKGSDLGSSELSRIERKSLYLTGIFFILSIIFSTFSIASTIINNVSLSSSLEKAALVVLAAGTALAAVLLGYWIDRKAASDQDKRSRLIPATRLLLFGALFGGAVYLAVIVAGAVGPIERAYLSALVGAPLFVSGVLGCVFGKVFRARVAKQAHIAADDKTSKTTELESPVLEGKLLGRRVPQVSRMRLR